MQRNPALLVLLTILALILGCSTQRRDFQRAEKLEQSGNPADALKVYESVLASTPKSATHLRSGLYYRMGDCLMQLDRIPEAFSAFQKAAENDPGNVPAKLRLGQFFLSAGAPDRAREQAESVLKDADGNSEALALWGAALAASGQIGKAKEAYRAALAVDPKRVSVSIALADLYNRDDQVNEAKSVLDEAIKLNPRSASPRLAMARLLEQEGEIAGAELCYRQAVAAEDTPETNLRLAQFLQRVARITDAEQVLRRVDAQRPGFPTALPDFELLAGRAASALDNYEAVLSSKLAQGRRRSRKWASNEETIAQRARLATRLVEANLEAASTKPERERGTAIAAARAQLDQGRPDLDEATIAILDAEIALASSDLPRANVAAGRALAMAPQSAPAHYVLGMIRLREGKMAEARAQWAAAVESDNYFAPARLAIAEQALRNGDAKVAEEFVVAVVRDEPANLRALNVFASVLAAEKRYGPATLIARRAQAVDSRAADPHIVLGHIALDEHRPAEALLQFEYAVLLDPHSVSAMDGLTAVYRTGRITRAMLRKMETVAASAPPSSTLMEIAGRLYAEHGWYADATRCLQSSLRMDPQRKSAAAVLAQTFAAEGNLRAAAESATRSGGDSGALLAGVQAEERNDVQGAIDNYERALQEGDHTGVAANNLAWLYAQRGTNLERALALAEAARSAAPENPAVLDTVGVVRLRLRRFSDAIAVLESARQIAGSRKSDPELLAKINEHLAEAYLRAGKTDAAQSLRR